MKNDRKSTTPIIAAHSEKNKNRKPAPPGDGNGSGTKARVSRVSKGAAERMKSIVLERIGDGIIGFDAEMNLVYVNERAGELLGGKPADLIGKNLWQEYPASIGTSFADACQRAFETQTVVPFEGHFPPSDGWFQGRTYPSEDGLSVLFTNGTRQEQEERQDRRHEERYRILFDTMQEGFVLAEAILDENGEPLDYRILEANASMARFLGKSREELVEHTASQVFTFDEQDLEILNRAGKVARGNEPFFIEDYSEILKRSFRIHVFSPGRGQFAALFSDITESKRTETALRKSEEKFSKAFHSSPSAMAIIRSKDGCFLDINQSLLDIFGLKRDQVVGKTIIETGINIADDERQALWSILNEKGNIQDHELTIHSPSGKRHHMLLSIELIDMEAEAYALVSAVDITERKQAEDKIRDLSRFPDQNPSPVVRCTANGELLYSNPAAAPLLSFWMQQAGQTIPTEWQELVKSVFESGSNMETEIKTDKKAFSCLLVPLPESGYVNVYCRDITERKLAEEALRESEQRYRTLFASIDEGFCVIEKVEGEVGDQLDFLYVEANPAFSLQTGIGDVIGKTIRQAFPGEPEEWFETYDDILRTGQPIKFERGLVTQGRVLELYAFRVADGTNRHVAVVFNDITERKQAEDALRQSEERFTQFMDHLPGLAWIKDIQGRYVYANAAAEKAFSTPREKLYGKTDQDVFYPEVAVQFRKNDEQVLRDEKGAHVVEKLRHNDRTLHYSLVTKFPIPGPDGNIALIGGTAFDISERVQMEEALQVAREKAEQTTHRIARIQKVTAALSEALTLSQVAEVVVDQGAPAFGAVSSSVMLLTEDGQTLEILYSSTPQALTRPSVRFPISLRIPAADAVRSGQPVWIESRQQYLERYPHLAEQINLWGHEAAIAIPMTHKGRILGVLTLSFDRILANDREDQDYALTLARQGAQALERARAEEALRESESRYRAIISQATAGIVRKDASGKLLFVNQAFCEMLGYSDAELMEKTMWQLTHQEDIEENKRLYNRLMMEGTPFQLEKRLIRRDGSTLWATVSVSPVLDAIGKSQSAVSVYADITKRKHAEHQLHRLNLELEERVQMRTAELQSAYEFLRESEATSRLILESMPDAIVITNTKGLIVHANKQLESLFGYSPKDVLGQPVETLLPEHVKHRHSYEDQKHRRIMGPGRELFGRHKDGSEFPVDVMLSPMSDSTTWDVMVTIRDNTEQKQAQDALRISEEKLRTLFEILPVGISFLDKDARITEVNSALANILGVPKTHLLKGSFKSRRYIRPDGTPMPPTEFASTRALTENKTIYNVETGIVKENDEITWTNVNAAPVQVAGVQAVVVTLDITQRKQAEEALQRNRERLRALSRRLVEVQEEERRALARELHDRVGQNLAALNLNLNILRSQLSEEFLQHVGSRLNDSVALVTQIFTITRNVMDDLRSNVLDDYGLEAALSEYTEKFTQRYGIQVVSDTPAEPIPRLNPGIEMTLLRIAQEALTNVARHAQATQVNVWLGMDEDSVQMTIQDNGSGILSWQKVNQPGSHGLRIIRERAEAFGGSLQVNSAYKKGTQIEVKIPLGSGSQNKVSS